MKQTIAGMMAAVFLMTGCAAIKIAREQYLTYVYPQSFDLVYLKTYETIDAQPDWAPLRTDRGNGIMEFRNTRYGNLFDYDTEHVTFVVTPVGRNETSLELDLSRSQCKGKDCLNLLKKAHEALKSLPSREEPEQQKSEDVKVAS